MEVNKIYFEDEEMRSTKMGAEMGKITAASRSNSYCVTHGKPQKKQFGQI
jgi:hypothetical protein